MSLSTGLTAGENVPDVRRVGEAGPLCEHINWVVGDVRPWEERGPADGADGLRRVAAEISGRFWLWLPHGHVPRQANRRVAPNCFGLPERGWLLDLHQ